MIAVNQKEKATFRIGQEVFSAYHPGEACKIVRKDWDAHGNLTYTVLVPSLGSVKGMGGVKARDLKRAWH